MSDMSARACVAVIARLCPRCMCICSFARSSTCTTTLVRPLASTSMRMRRRDSPRRASRPRRSRIRCAARELRHEHALRRPCWSSRLHRARTSRVARERGVSEKRGIDVDEHVQRVDVHACRASIACHRAKKSHALSYPRIVFFDTHRAARATDTHDIAEFTRCARACLRARRAQHCVLL